MLKADFRTFVGIGKGWPTSLGNDCFSKDENSFSLRDIENYRAKALSKLTPPKKFGLVGSVSHKDIPMQEPDETKRQSKPVVETASAPDLFEQMEHRTRQQIKIVGRTVFCFRCDGSKEIASFYCACGSFLCTLHLTEHSCLVSASMQYNEELLAALT